MTIAKIPFLLGCPALDQAHTHFLSFRPVSHLSPPASGWFKQGEKA